MATCVLILFEDISLVKMKTDDQRWFGQTSLVKLFAVTPHLV